MIEIIEIYNSIRAADISVNFSQIRKLEIDFSDKKIALEPQHMLVESSTMRRTFKIGYIRYKFNWNNFF